MSKALPRRQLSMMSATAIFALLCLIEPPFAGSIAIQTGPTFVILAILFASSRKWPLNDRAIACCCAFLVLHTIAARYIYSYVPYDLWLGLAGLPPLSEVFGWERNHFDRLVHFSFGALAVYPISYFLTEHWRVSSGRALYVAVEFIIATSALYEIFEWLLTLALSVSDAEAYNGQQGDLWDPQKDMALAALGAVIVGLSLFFRYLRRAQVGTRV